MATPLPAAASRAQPSPRVLIVDDRWQNIEVLESMLYGLCEVVSAISGKEALERAQDFEPALVFVDVDMPGMNGFETLQSLHQLPGVQDVPAIFVTAHTPTREMIDQAYSSGGIDYILKPIDPHSVRSKTRVFLDLYQRRKDLELMLEQQLRTNRVLQELGFAASHHLKEPLRSIRTYSELLLADQQSASANSESDYLNKLVGASSFAESMIVRLAGLMHACTDPIATSTVSLKSLIDKCRSKLEAAFPETALSITVNEDIQLTGDAKMLDKLFEELLTNSVVFRQAKRAAIRVSCQRERGVDTITIVDDGMGFDNEYGPKLFSVFSRVHPKGTYPGTGVGLAICREIAERHGGTIALRSAEHQGTTAIVRLPAVEPAS